MKSAQLIFGPTNRFSFPFQIVNFAKVGNSSKYHCSYYNKHIDIINDKDAFLFFTLRDKLIGWKSV